MMKVHDETPGHIQHARGMWTQGIVAWCLKLVHDETQVIYKMLEVCGHKAL